GRGFFEIVVDGQKRKIGITRAHLEEDAGKLIHPPGKNYSLVDYNRAGVPLLEIVSEPDIRSATEARIYLQSLQNIMRYLGVSDADMEKGHLRCDANISLRKTGEEGFPPYKVEVKNMNSFKAVANAIDSEIQRQTVILEAGDTPVQETRGWHDAKEITFSQRIKEEAHDYRYFPEPDLPPLRHSAEFINNIKAEIPELPQSRRERLQQEYGLLSAEIEIFVLDKGLGEYFEKVVSEFPSNLAKENLLKLIKIASNYLITDLKALMNGRSVADKNFLIIPEDFSEFTQLIYEGKISSKMAKIILREMFLTGADPSHIIEEKGLSQISDESEIEKIVKDIILQNLKSVEDFKKGKTGVLQFLMGQALIKSRGKANPAIVEKVFRRLLTE
ncbi:MAG: Asp-tRNA(Asn)/Glu-tRNA(Gln) amidotransferase subunit GatB, partial [Candidatus Nealsonbacteria bacterium]|nr:Asp-tRNA(Asn)/Glu-tRNA(Gln) amidotransferase subunit GatB [Candidatus Nealsonbacteria bacterium]